LFPWNEVSNYVALYFTHNITIGRIRKWLEDEENKAQLENLLSNLPKEPRSRLSDKRVFWGEIVWRMKNMDPDKTWSDIEKELVEFVERDIDENSIGKNDDDFDDFVRNIPTATELAKIYTAYKKTKDDL